MKRISALISCLLLLVSCGNNSGSVEKELQNEYVTMELQHDSMENELNITIEDYLKLKAGFDTLKILKSKRIDSLMAIEDSLIQVHKAKVNEHTTLVKKHKVLEELHRSGKVNDKQLKKDHEEIRDEHIKMLGDHQKMKTHEKLLFEEIKRSLDQLRKSSE